MSQCEQCGSEVDNKNAAGHYRDKCLECIKEEAHTPETGSFMCGRCGATFEKEWQRKEHSRLDCPKTP